MIEKMSSVDAAPRWLAWLVPVLVFFFPLVVATTDGGGSYVGVLLLLPALFLGRGWGGLEAWERRLLLGFVAAFLVMALSLVNTHDLYDGAKYLERYLRIALIIPMYLLFRRFGFALGWALGAGAVLATLVMAAQACYQVEWLGEHMASGSYHKIVFGDLAVLWGALAALFALTYIGGWKGAAVIAVTTIAALYASLLSQTRGAWLFIPVFLLILAWVYRHRLLASGRVMAAAAMVLVVVLAAGVWQAERLIGGVRQGVSDIRVFVDDPSAGTSWGIRLNLWRNTLLLLAENPLLGTGLGDFHQEMREMAADGRSWSPAVAEFGHAHSIYFEALASTGILGLLATVTAYLLLPLAAFVRGLRNAATAEQRFYAAAGIMVVLAFATFGLSEALWARNPFVNSYVMCLVVFLTGLAGGHLPTKTSLSIERC